MGLVELLKVLIIGILSKVTSDTQFVAVCGRCCIILCVIQLPQARKGDRVIAACIDGIARRPHDHSARRARDCRLRLVSPVHCALERLETSEHGCRLNKINMMVQNVRETVARGPDDALSGLIVLVNIVSLDTD